MKEKIVSAILVIAMVLTVTLPITTFASSNHSSWATEEVNAAINAELVTDSVMVNYQANITREQFCEMVVRAYEKISGENAETGNMYFSDTNNVEILKAANLGIVTGYGNNVFGPNDLITREQIATMLVRMIDKSVSYANINVYNDNYFIDKNSISDWAVSSVNFAYDKGIMQGVGNNCIDPQANTTCEQAILLVYRTVNKYYNEESQLDSIYELTKEHIAQDDETLVHYTDNILLAFITRGLSEDEKNDIADIVDGEVVAQLAGSINLLQIEVDSSTLDELNKLSEKLMKNNDVYYVSPDILRNKDVLQYGAIEKPYTQSNYNGENEWWVDAVDAQEVWNNYEEYVNNYSVGVIDSIIHINHNELEKRVTFATQYYENLNHEKMLEVSECDSGYANHGSAISGIISASRDGIGVTGIANQSNIVFANFEANEEDWNSFSGDLYALKKLVESGVLLINESIQEVYYDEAYFMKYKDSDHIYPEHFMHTETYESYRKAMELFLKVEAKIYSSTLCQLIKNGEDILIVQCAGNGKNNIAIKGECTGVDARNAGMWTCVTESYCDDIINKYGLTKKELREHIMIVGAVENSKQDENYLMTGFSNYGNIVDICAPGQDIVVCNATGKYIDENKKEYNTWYNPSSGTSEAAPMVTGTAAVLWGIDPTLTAAEVKEYIIKGSKCKAIGVTGEDAGREYPMLNVRGAVEELLKTKCATITVGDKDTNGRISDATISYGNGLNETTDMIGNCDIYLVDDNHEITISKEGYKTVTVIVEDNYIGQDSEWIDVKEILLEKEKTIDYSTYIGKWDWENSIPLLNNQENWGTYNEAWIDIKNINNNQITFDYYHQMGGSHLYFYDTCTGYIENNSVSVVTNARKIPGDPVMAQFKITLNLYDDNIYLESYNLDAEGVAFEGEFYRNTETTPITNIIKYNFDDLLSTPVFYDLNLDGTRDSLKVNMYPVYNENIRDNCGRYELVINNTAYHIADIRHGGYQKVYLADLNPYDSFIDIVLISVYKGATAEIYQYDGKHLSQSYHLNVSNNRNIYEDNLIDQIDIILDSESGFSFVCGDEGFGYERVESLECIEVVKNKAIDMGYIDDSNYLFKAVEDKGDYWLIHAENTKSEEIKSFRGYRTDGRVEYLGIYPTETNE